jgi:hypothetical protein
MTHMQSRPVERPLQRAQRKARGAGIRWVGPSVLLALIAASGPATAAGSFAVGADLGTSGIGAELAYRLSPKFVIRGDYDYFKYDGDIRGEVLTYKGDLKLQTGGAFLDFHPFNNPWLLSGGAYVGTRAADAQPTLQDVNRIGGDSFLRAEVGVVQAKLKLDQFTPFLGGGWNNTFYNNRWGFKVLAGAAFSNQPRVTLTRTGGATLDPAVAQRLATAFGIEEGSLSRDADILKVYPVLQVGLTFRF